MEDVVTRETNPSVPLQLLASRWWVREIVTATRVDSKVVRIKSRYPPPLPSTNVRIFV